MDLGMFTEQDAQTFATKLDAFSQTLTSGEQVILTLIEQQLGTLAATSTDDDVQGYMIDLGDAAMLRQREMLLEADRFRAGARLDDEKAATAAEDRAGFWQRIAVTLGRQATAMAPRATGQPATN